MGNEATLSGRLSERTTRRDCVKLESMNAEATWYDGTWNDWRWRTPDRWESLSSTNPQGGWTWHDIRLFKPGFATMDFAS